MSSAKVVGTISVFDLFSETKQTKPEGYHYVKEIAKRVGLSESHVAKKMKEAFDSGEVDRVHVHSGFGTPMIAYRVEM